MNPIVFFLMWVIAIGSLIGLIFTIQQFRAADEDLRYTINKKLNGHRLIVAKTSVTSLKLSIAYTSILSLIGWIIVVLYTTPLSYPGISTYLVGMLAVAVVLIVIDRYLLSIARKKILNLPIRTEKEPK